MKVMAFFFTGTGNTKMILGCLIEKLGHHVSTFQKIAVEDVFLGKRKIEMIDEDTLLMIAYPIYDLKAPHLILDLIRRLPLRSIPCPTALIATPALIIGDAHDIALRKLQKKGYYTIAKLVFFCPSNGVTTYERPDHPRWKNVRFQGDITQKLVEGATLINRKYATFGKKAFCLSAQRSVASPIIRFFSGRLYGDRYYRGLQVSTTCISCGLCAKSCPVGNLRINAGRLSILNNGLCMSCLRCITECPVQAIDFTSSKRQGTYSEKFRNDLFKKATMDKGRISK